MEMQGYISKEKFRDVGPILKEGLTFSDCFSLRVPWLNNRVAARFQDRELTYSELNARANRLAQYLLTLGVEPEALVAICLERSLDVLVALLAVCKAGGAFLPLDPAYPGERLAYLLAEYANQAAGSV